MKKLNLILFIAIGAFFISCEKDSEVAENMAAEETNLTEENALTEENSSTEENSMLEEINLTGEWQLTGFEEEDGQVVSTLGGQSSTQPYTSVGKDYEMTITFNEDPHTVVSDGTFGKVSTSVVFGENQTSESIAEVAFNASEWRMDDQTVIFINNDEETEVRVNEFSNDKIVISYDFLKIESDEELNFEINTSSVVTITLER